MNEFTSEKAIGKGQWTADTAGQLPSDSKSYKRTIINATNLVAMRNNQLYYFKEYLIINCFNN